MVVEEAEKLAVRVRVGAIAATGAAGGAAASALSLAALNSDASGQVVL